MSPEALQEKQRGRNICPLSACVRSVPTSVSNNSSASPIDLFRSNNSRLLPSPFFQRIVSCTKVGSILREARDRVVSLTTDARSSVVACHVSAAVFFRTQKWGDECVFSHEWRLRRILRNAERRAEGQGQAAVEVSGFTTILLHQGNDSTLEVFRVLPEAEVQQKMKKKEKKAKKKAAQ